MRRSIVFTLIYIFIFFIVSVPLILNIKINELSNKINEIDKEILILEIQKLEIDVNYHKNFSISSIEKLARAHSYERLEINQKINVLEIPYKIKNHEKEQATILGFSR